MISIHTALAGCDGGVFHPSGCDGISIHTALAGCDLVFIVFYSPFKISIHTALAGCDGKGHRAAAGQAISIHTALAGCDHHAPGKCPQA